MKTHFTYFLGNTTEIMFSGWPGQSLESYMLALVSVFLLSLVVEWLSHMKLIDGSTADNYVSDGLKQTLMYAIRVGLAYLVMLAVMSFNVGVLLAAISGYAVGFLIFGTRVFMRSKKIVPNMDQTDDLTPINCC
ncbi:PREDICTED: copper [Prunus dulcis]|uniref:Copper transport protein n=1 Tax=Prunus dulcis TaxID=3755 RepID=A0A5E4FQW7_PRUDU|nr:hypothetical protein L3X38_030917 [Prunus dulcis]VVA29780.1 PREDICTED: copper [Prunus dulcis]